MLDLSLLSITYQFFDIKDRITYHAQTMHMPIAEASLHYYLQLWRRGCGQISTWVWFWRRNPSTVLWNCLHHRRSPGRANKLQAVENQHSQKRHLHDFRENFPPHFLLIFWQNALYLYLGRTRICLILQKTLFQDQVLKPCKSVQDSSLSKIQVWKVPVIKARHLAIYWAWKVVLAPWLDSNSTNRVSVEVYEKHNFRSVLTLIRDYVFELYFLTTLNI